MLTGIHFLLTYKCIFECDHCFVYSSPTAKGTFTLKQIKNILKETSAIKSIEWVYFEGGEPFLYYPLMIEGIKIANQFGFKVGVVTNAYFATSEEDAELWLQPLSELEINDLSISDDIYHNEDEKDNLAKRALKAAKSMKFSVNSICIEKPIESIIIDENQQKGKPIIKGGVMFRGRAVEKLVGTLSKRSWTEFKECPYEDLKNPERIHLDSYGNVHLCQGLLIGNMWKTPLSELIQNYNSDLHPICKLLIQGGPALLAKEYRVEHNEEYIDACHFCYTVRLSLIEKFPQYLAPKQIYGLL